MAKKKTLGKRQLGAAKVITKAGTVWCHLSVRDNTLKLRRFSEGTSFEIDAESDDIEDFVPLPECKKIVKSKSYAHTKIEVWTKILQKLEAGTAVPTRTSAKRSAAKNTIVPITELRRVYDVMKLLDVATFVNLANFYRKTPESLERLWNGSGKTFKDYRNDDDWGKGECEDLPDSPEELSQVSTTNQFTAFLKENGLGDTGYTFVERELNPWRTRRGMFSNKSPATKSGRGGMDLLLRSEASRFPVVGEVKVKDDKNAFYALIQAMTYAVELSTPHQLRRLKNNIDEFKDLCLERAKVEIAILMVNHRDTDETLKPVLELIGKLNKRQKCSGLAHLTLLRNRGNNWWRSARKRDPPPRGLIGM